MKLLDRYIATQVVGAVFLILLVVIGLDLVFELVAQGEDMNERYGLKEVFVYLLLRVPGRVYEFLPLASLIGCLVGLGMLASHSELTVMRAAGISLKRIVWGVLKPALLLAAIALGMGEYVVPKTEQLAQSTRAVAQAGGQALKSRYGVWHREGNQFIHINAVELGGVIHGVTRYTFNEQRQMIAASFAEKGSYQAGEWQLENISRTRFVKQRTETEQQRSETWSSGLTPTLLSVIVVDPMDLSMTGLWSYAHYLEEQGLNAQRYLLAFWSKVLQPLGIMALVLVGISFVFGPLRSVTVGQRIVAGVIVGLVFKFSQDLLAPASAVVGFTPLLATLIPIVVCLGLGWVLLRRAG